MDDAARNRRQLGLPILAHVQQRHVGTGGAALEELRGLQFIDHQNTNPWAAVALISGSMTVSNKLSRIHSVRSTRRTKIASITGAEPITANKRPPTASARSKRAS